MAEPSPKLIAIVRVFDWFTDSTGCWIALLNIPMMLAGVYEVMMRYVFYSPSIWVFDFTYMRFASVFMLGAAYALRHEEHVRVDIFYRAMAPRRRAWVDALGVVLFLLPLCGYLLFESWDFVAVSWAMGEASRESGGLPYPFIPILKSVLLVMPVLLALQGLSLLHSAVRTLRRPAPAERP
jgi:TRAP-type mannitol/chloroaromatic compound transport system permease small subunit